jgi:hypothetical protein
LCSPAIVETAIAQRKSITAGGIFYKVPPELPPGFYLKVKIRTFARLCLPAGTIADRELQPKITRSGPLAAILVFWQNTYEK